MMASGAFVATLCGRQWTVRDVRGETVAWIAPAGGAVWTISTWGPFSGGTHGYVTPRDAFDAVCVSMAGSR